MVGREPDSELGVSKFAVELEPLGATRSAAGTWQFRANVKGIRFALGEVVWMRGLGAKAKSRCRVPIADED